VQCSEVNSFQGNTMKAEDLKMLADQKNIRPDFWSGVLDGALSKEDLEEWVKKSYDDVYLYVQTFIEVFLEERAKGGHYKAILEPFRDLPAILHGVSVENKIMSQWSLSIDKELRAIWDRRDGRLILEVEW